LRFLSHPVEARELFFFDLFENPLGVLDLQQKLMNRCVFWHQRFVPKVEKPYHLREHFLVAQKKSSYSKSHVVRAVEKMQKTKKLPEEHFGRILLYLQKCFPEKIMVRSKFRNGHEVENIEEPSLDIGVQNYNVSFFSVHQNLREVLCS